MRTPTGRSIFLGLCLLLALALPLGVLAQTAGAGSASLSEPDLSQFPAIRFYLDVSGADNRTLGGLRSSQLAVVEDGQRLEVTALEELHPGSQYVVAVNPGRVFAIRDGLGFSRYDRLLEALTRWSESHLSSHANTRDDDLSLLVTDGPELLHVTSSAEWMDALLSYEGDQRSAVPSLEVLDMAIDAAADPTPREGMGRGVLFITAPLEADFAVGLQNIAARSRQEGVNISIWLITYPEDLDSPQAKQMEELALQTGGSFFAYSGTEPIPDLESYLENASTIYQLEYRSQAHASGPHEVSVEVQAVDLTIISAPVQFELNVQPPVAVFVSPPSEIERQYKPAGSEVNGEKIAEGQVIPPEQELEVLIEFPDGFVRQVLTTTLWVDGVAAVQQAAEPFGMFNWDLTPYSQSSSHVIRVEVVDELGMVGTSIEKAVQVNVTYPPQGVLVELSSRTPLIAALAVLLAGSVLVVVLVLGGKFTPHTMGKAVRADSAQWPWSKQARRPVSKNDPLTQPVSSLTASEAASGEARGQNWFNRLHWHQRQMAPRAEAFLSYLSENVESDKNSPIPLAAASVSIGRDEQKAVIALDDPSVEPVHARLVREGDHFRICDEGSVAGTWVNYTPVSKEGIMLEHGDLVHIGKIGFRFTLRSPQKVRKPVVKPEEPSQ